MKKFSNFRGRINEQSVDNNIFKTNVQTNDVQTTNVQTNDVQTTNVQTNDVQKDNVETEVKSDVSCLKLFSKLFEAREMAHIYHLQTTGAGAYAQHTALGDFYDKITDLNDSLIETYQGQYEIVEGYDIIDTKTTKSQDSLTYLTSLVDIIKTERKNVSEEDSHLHNIIDEIVTLIYRTNFKLKHLK